MFAAYLLEAAALHALSLADRSEQRQGAAAWVPIGATVAMAVAVGYFAVAALHAQGIKPFA